MVCALLGQVLFDLRIAQVRFTNTVMYVSRVMYRVSSYLCSVNKNVKKKKKIQ